MKDTDETIDLEKAIEKANLTEHQRAVLALWLIGHTQDEIADMVGTKRPAVTRLLGRIAKRIAGFM